MDDADDLHFEWDDAKAASNLARHGVAFEAAAAVFDDPARLEEDDLFAREEYRTIMIGPYPHHFRPTGERKRTQGL